MRRPLLTVALWFTGGILIAEWVSAPVSWLFALAATVVTLSALWPRGRSWILCLALVAAGWVNAAWRKEILSAHDLRVRAGEQPQLVAIRGRMVEPPVQRILEHEGETNSRTHAVVEVRALRRGDDWQPAAGRVAVTLPGELPAGYVSGREVELFGLLRVPPGARAEGLFDYRAYLRRLGIRYELQTRSPGDWRLAEADQGPAKTSWPERFTAWARRALAHGLPGEDEALRLTWAMTLGWRTALTDEVSTPFMRSGTMHVFAISGLHIALIAAILVCLLRGVQLPRPVCALVVMGLIWFYTVATGWQPSAIRSTIMASVVLFGWLVRRPSDLANSLGAAAFLILVLWPEQLFQASFQLSFGVVFSIALAGPAFQRLQQRLLEPDPLLPPELRPRWQRWLDMPLRFVLATFFTSLAAWLGSALLCAHYFHLFTPAGLVANLLIVPLSGLALMSNLGSLLCGWWPAVNEIFNHAGWLWMHAMIRISEWAAALPGGWFHVPSPPGPVLVTFYAGLLAGTAGWLATWRRRLTAIATVVLVAACCAWAARAGFSTVRITVLPAAGGDAIFVDEPGRDDDVFIDGGNESTVRFIAMPFLRGQGVNRPATMVLTHGDDRHVGGAGMLLEDFRPLRVVTGPVRFRSPAFREVSARLAATPGRGREVSRGESVGRWSVLHPPADTRLTRADDAALVLRATIHGARVLLLSDLGRAGQDSLLASSADLRADILIAGLPGQDKALGEVLLAAVQPRLIIVSCADHPAYERAPKELRERLAQRGVPVFYLSESEAVTVELRAGAWTIRPMTGPRVELKP
jgi:ComEC/Rec2-related protein